MDTRTDPGQYYPGGRVMVRPDVAPPQIEVNVSWSDIKNKPDFSDIAALGAADSVGNVKTAVNKIVDKMNTAIIVLLCGLCAVLSAPAATALNDLSGTNEVYTAAETDAAIVRLAPAPGNYAAVSNAAMNALSRTEAEAGFTEWTILHDGVDVTAQVAQPQWSTSDNAWIISVVSGETANVPYPSGGDLTPTSTNLQWLGNDPDSGAVVSQYTATRARLPTMADLEAKASTNDVQLTPVYGGNGERLGEWICSVSSGESLEAYVVKVGGYWEVHVNTVPPGDGTYYPVSDEGQTEIDFDGETDGGISFHCTATRTENPIIGYTLGSQTDKVIAPTNGIPTRMSQLTNDVGYVTILPLTNGTIQVGFAQEAYHAGTADFATAAENANSAESATTAQSLSYEAGGLSADAIVGTVGAAARSATNYTDSVFADATNRIAALEAELQGLANALHVINTGTNLVTGGGN